MLSFPLDGIMGSLWLECECRNDKWIYCYARVNEALIDWCCQSIVWSILALELIFEWLIRPSNYYLLTLSEKAYAPSSARYINGFHLVSESIALLMFIPEFDCLSTKVCGKRIFFSGVDAALNAVYGPTRARGAFGRLCIGLISLRIIGLVRHWKIMWINRTFRDNAVAIGGKPDFIETIQVNSITGRSMVVKRKSVVTVSFCATDRFIPRTN